MEALDADGNGELSSGEIDNAANTLRALDKDGDGTINFEEIHPKPIQEEDGFVARILSNDRDGDGMISEEELPDQMKSLMGRADLNEDGFIEAEEIEEMADQKKSKLPSETRLKVGDVDTLTLEDDE